MRRFTCLLVPLSALLPLSAQALILSDHGQARATVVLAAAAGPAERTAAQELAAYLGQVTGGTFAVASEGSGEVSGTRLFVGPTAAAAKLGLDAGKLAREEWVVRSGGEDLYLLGEGPRGTLYAVYHFLEDVIGIHWWNPWEESVPRQPSLRVAALNRRGKPALRYRDIYMLYGRDGGRFAARNRLNRDGDAAIDSKYGGTLAYGPPYHVHTFEGYFPPEPHFAQHPEWFSLLDGKRSGDRTQLCLTNPELRQAFLAKLRSYIETSWADAKAKGLPPPLVFSVSQNDWNNPCQCDPCQAIAKAEGSEIGPILDLVNYLADSIKDKYPEIYIDTLAYSYTQQPPKTMRPRDNVIIRLCDTGANMLQPLTHRSNAPFQETLRTWSRIARNLRVWDYAVTYGTLGMPLPTAHTFGPDYRYYLAHNVEGVFTELEYEILADMRDFKIWTMIKALEDPTADYQRLVTTFTEGFYGPAGRYVHQYLDELLAEAMVRDSQSTCWHGSPQKLTYLNLDFVARAQRLFTRAEQAVREDPVLLRRVRHARLPLDRATVMAYPQFMATWLGRGGDAARIPLDRARAARRALNTWRAQADLRLPESLREAEKQAAEAELRRYAALPAAVALPEKFRHLPRAAVVDYTAGMTRNWDNIVKTVKDPEAESGYANRLLLSDEKPANREKYRLPMPWGLYDSNNAKGFSGQAIDVHDVPGPGYHWYKMGTFSIAPSYYLYFFWSWIIQVDLDNAFDPLKPRQKFDMWARLKFEGPTFPHGRAADADAIYVERLVLVKVGQ